MAYTSVLPVHRLDRSIDYVKDRTKTTKSAGSLEEAIDYALNREKTEETIFEDAIGCTCENAYADMVKTKERLELKSALSAMRICSMVASSTPHSRSSFSSASFQIRHFLSSRPWLYAILTSSNQN